jgi:hypothetical protein
MSDAVGDRGTGGASFAAVIMIIAGTMGVFEGLSLIAKGTYYVQPSGYWINTGRVDLGLGPHSRQYRRPGCRLRRDLGRHLGALDWHHHCGIPNRRELPIHPGDSATGCGVGRR